MSKIVFLAHSNTFWVHPISPDGYVQGFCNALSRMGNEVKSIILNELTEEEVGDEIVSFRPDFIFTINNGGIFKSVLDGTNCPIILVVSDSLPFLKNLNLVREYKERYYFLHTSKDSYDQIDAVFPDTPSDRNVILGHVTDLRKQDIEQDISVSFIGSLGNWDKSVPMYWRSLFNIFGFSDEEAICQLNNRKKAFIDQLNEYAAAPLDTSGSVLNHPVLEKFSEMTGGRNYAQAIVMLRTCNLRYAVLSRMKDLGLKVFSYPYGMVDVVCYDIELFDCFDLTPSVTLQDSAYNFNRSKISLNLPHAHVVEGFSWRVPDILASNACLLSDYRPDLKRLMTGYIDMPMYHSPAEARDLAQKLLKDEVWRKEIVAASQQMIEDKCRFEHRLRKVVDKTGLKLEDSSGKSDLILYGDDRKEIYDARINSSGKEQHVHKGNAEARFRQQKVIPVSPFTEELFRLIFKTLILGVFSKKKRKYLRKRFLLGTHKNSG